MKPFKTPFARAMQRKCEAMTRQLQRENASRMKPTERLDKLARLQVERQA